MNSYISLINDTRTKIKIILGDHINDDTVIVDDNIVYAVCLKIKMNKKSYTPSQICLSHDIEAGLFIEIDQVTWEYIDDKKAFHEDAVKLANAIKNNRIKLVEKKIFGITISKKIIVD